MDTGLIKFGSKWQSNCCLHCAKFVHNLKKLRQTKNSNTAYLRGQNCNDCINGRYNQKCDFCKGTKNH